MFFGMIFIKQPFTNFLDFLCENANINEIVMLTISIVENSIINVNNVEFVEFAKKITFIIDIINSAKEQRAIE